LPVGEVRLRRAEPVLHAMAALNSGSRFFISSTCFAYFYGYSCSAVWTKIRSYREQVGTVSHMRQAKPLLMLALSLMFGIVAVIFAASWKSSTQRTTTVKVVVAAQDIPLGTRLGAGALKVVDWPQATVIPGTFDELATVDGRVARANLVAGEPVLESKLAARGSTGGLAASIGDGRRAMTVKVNEVVGVAGFALPGNYVDVLVNMKDLEGRPVSKIVLERMLVLAIAQEASRDDSRPKVVNAVTLEVTPQQAEKLDLARSVGTLSLVLRNQIDSEAIATAGVRPDELLSLLEPRLEPVGATQAAPKPPAPAPRRSAPRRSSAKAKGAAPQKTASTTVQVELIKGIQRTSVEFP
jgi:pilus assembly protein CpaB